MNFSSFLKTLALIAVAVGAYFAYQYEKTQRAVLKLKAELLTERDTRDLCKTPWLEFEPTQIALAQTAAKTAALQQKKMELEEKVANSTEELKKLAAAARAAVDKVQSAAAEQVIPELKLQDGKVLKDAKLRKIEPGQISFTHLDGIGSVPFSQLPMDLLERLDVGNDSLLKAALAAELDLIMPATTLSGLTLKSPMTLAEKQQRSSIPAIIEIKGLEGKRSDELEVAVSSIRYAKGTAVDLDAAATGSLKAMTSLDGMSNVKQQSRDVTVSNLPGKRTSMSAKRFGGEIFAESLILYHNDQMWMIIVGYSGKTKSGPQTVESIFDTVQVDTKS